MLKWDVWSLDQNNARENTEPPQPNDTKPTRNFLIVSPSSMNRVGKYVVCLPIQSNSDGSSFSVLVKKGASGLNWDSYVRCTDYYTFDKSFFKSKKGHIKDTEQDDVSFAIAEFFQLIGFTKS